MSEDLELRRIPSDEDAALSSPLPVSGSAHDDAESLRKSEAWMLYASHACSTWNARSYEFAAIIYTAQAFPGTLFYSSLRGLITTLCVLLLSSTIGTFIDRLPSRRGGLNGTIIINRTTVLLCCILWISLLSNADSSPSFIPNPQAPMGRHLVFASLILFGILERLSGIANMLTMERDWVPAVAVPAASASTANANAYTLTRLNATMRRVDLICKLFAPLAISAIIEWFSTPTSVLLLAISNIFGLVIEPQLASYVWSRSKKLQAPKVFTAESSTTSSSSADQQSSSWWRLDTQVWRFLVAQKRQATAYFSTNAWLPSLSLALLYFSALSYSATFVTWLLGSGFSLGVITIARTVGSCVEVSSTFVAPFGINKLAYTRDRRDTLRNDSDERSTDALLERDMGRQKEHITGLARSGLWSLILQLACLFPVVLAILSINSPPAPPQPQPPTTNSTLNLDIILRSLPKPFLPIAIVLFTFLSISRLGLWIFDLCVQELDQILVPAGQQAAFAGTETAFSSLFELGQWALVAVLSSPDQFVWVAVLSIAAVALSAVTYAGWHLRLRGHLVHWDKMCGGWGKQG